MEHKLVECVPNFSEGKDKAKIKQITDAIEAVAGVTLLDVDPGADTNRTVVTFIGSPKAVAEAAFQAIAKAAQVIDMSVHKGEHPRMGATDVVPFIPVAGMDMDECVQLAKKVAERVGRELEIPIYLYEHAATTPERSNLAYVRKGEYEALPEKMQKPEWKPDFGPQQFNAKSGATVIGAREFLVAYNITLNSRDKNLATDIAFELREKGRVARTPSNSPLYSKGNILFYQENTYPCGNCNFTAKTQAEIIKHCQDIHGYSLPELLQANDIDTSKSFVGQKVYKRGLYSYCKAIGWYVEEYKRAQLSINLTNYKVTPPHIVLEETRKLAQERGLVVTGSEIVGMVPYAALYEAGKYYLAKQGKSTGIPVEDVLQTAVFSMGLSDVQPFDLQKKVLGLPHLKGTELVAMNLKDFASEVSRDTPAPGGGSIAALGGSLGASLASMVCNLTQGKIENLEVDKLLIETADKSQQLKDNLMYAVDADTQAFNAYMEARRLPSSTPAEKTLRAEKMEEGLKEAVHVPWQTAQMSFEAMQAAYVAVKHGNINSITDGAVGAQIAFAGVKGGIWNVVINLKDIADKDYVTKKMSDCSELQRNAEKLLKEITEFVDAKLQTMIK